MKKLGWLIALFTYLGSHGQTGIPVPQMAQCDNLVNNFLTTYNIPGATFALSKNGKIVYLRSFGFADRAGTIPVQPYHLFRIASVSKPITAIAIMKMVQDGLLTLTSKVFGPGGLLQNHPVLSTAAITDARIYSITVQHLLEHTAGWNRNVNCNPNPTAPYPYYFAGCDPINNPLTITQALGLPNPVTEDAYCLYMLQKGLNFAPGTQHHYSNIGYLYLGEIIEQLSGVSYEDYVKTNILAPLGIYDMHIGKNLLHERLEREVEYTGNGYTNLSVYGDGASLPWEYGGMNVNAMDAHGGWITTAKDLVKLVTAVDGFATKPDILTATTINAMTTPSPQNANYAKGWQVNSLGNWWHTGSIPGTASIMARTSGGYTWVVILNKRNETNNNFWGALDALPWNCLSATSSWPGFDLLLSPTQNASGISFTNVTSTSLTVQWASGNGEKRLLAVRQGAAVDAFPLDGTDYLANANFTQAPVLGNGARLVYNGSGNSVTVTGLQAGIIYHFRLSEYNQSSATGNNALYLLGNNAKASVATSVSLPLTLSHFEARNAGAHTSLHWMTSQEAGTSHFAVQRSIDGSQFDDIARVEAAGNSNNGKTYQFTDFDDVAGKVYYRLKMVDRDEAFSYSPVVVVEKAKDGKIVVSPNPAMNWIRIKGVDIVKAEVLGIAGNRLLAKSFLPTSDVRLDLSHLAAGSYILVITEKAGRKVSERIILQKH